LEVVLGVERGEALAMKRTWNWAVWTGASLVFLGVISYPLFFVRFPALRDFPWANLPMVALGLVLLALGLVRAFRRSDLFRGKIFGSVLAVLALAFSGFFLYGIFIGSRHVLPASHGAPQVGQTAPVVGTDGDEAGVTDFHLAVKVDQTLGLALVSRAESSPAKHEDQGIWPL
jgi:hypothetical protein